MPSLFLPLFLCDNITEKAAGNGYTVIKQKERSYPLWQL